MTGNSTAAYDDVGGCFHLLKEVSIYIMLPAIILFAVTYVLMISFGKYRPYIALASGLLFIFTGMLPMNQIIGSLDFNVLLMIGGTMGLVQLFIDSHMPERLADIILTNWNLLFSYKPIPVDKVQIHKTDYNTYQSI